MWGAAEKKSHKCQTGPRYHVCSHIHIHTHKHTYTHSHIHTCTLTHTLTHARTNARAHTQRQTCVNRLDVGISVRLCCHPFISIFGSISDSFIFRVRVCVCHTHTFTHRPAVEVALITYSNIYICRRIHTYTYIRIHTYTSC